MNDNELTYIQAIRQSEKLLLQAKKAISDNNKSIFLDLGCLCLEDEDYGVWSY